MWEIGEPSGPIENGTTYIVRPRIEPRKRSSRTSRISSGSRQLLVGPASSSFFGADEGPVLDPGDVAGIGERQVGVGPLGVGELLEGPGLDQLLAEPVVFLRPSRRTSGSTRARSARRSPRPRRSACVLRWVPPWRRWSHFAGVYGSSAIDGCGPRSGNLPGGGSCAKTRGRASRATRFRPASDGDSGVALGRVR